MHRVTALLCLVLLAPVAQATGPTTPPSDGLPADCDKAETQRQLLLTIEIDVALPYAVAPDGDEPVAADDDTEGAEARAAATAQAQKAADFVDALGVGPRLISPIDVAYSGTKLTVTVLAYFQVEES